MAKMVPCRLFLSASTTARSGVKSVLEECDEVSPGVSYHAAIHAAAWRCPSKDQQRTHNLGRAGEERGVRYSRAAETSDAGLDPHHVGALIDGNEGRCTRKMERASPRDLRLCSSSSPSNMFSRDGAHFRTHGSGGATWLTRTGYEAHHRLAKMQEAHKGRAPHVTELAGYHRRSQWETEACSSDTVWIVFCSASLHETLQRL